MTPVLQLEGYFFDDIHIVASDVQGEGESRVETELKIAQDDENKGTWRIILGIVVVSLEDQPPPAYDVKLKVYGVVSEDLELPLEERRDIAAINGGSILYSAAREFVLMITSRGIGKPFKLPTVRFMKTPEIEEDSEADEQP